MHIIIKTILLLSLLSSYTSFFSQNAKNERKVDILHMKNGKKIKGIIKKHELGVVTIELTDSLTNKVKTQIYQQNDIAKIEKRSLGKVAKQKNDSLKYSLENGEKGKIIKSKGTSTKKTSSLEIPPELLPDRTKQPIISTPIPLPDEKRIQAPIMMPGTNVTTGEQLSDEVDLVDLHKAPKPLNKYKGWYRQIKGFRMFLDYGYIIGTGKTKNNRMEFATSLGYQFNPIFYTGIGTGGVLSLNDKDHSLPVFINGRINFMDEYTTPYIDIRTGYSVAEGRGYYFSASAGVSFTKKGKHAFNLGLTYSSQNVKYYEWQNRERVAIREAQHGLGLRLSFEF